MIKQAIDILKSNPPLSLSEISLKLNADKTAVQAMLEVLVKKGKIEEIKPACTSGCGGSCSSCNPESYYKIIS